MFTRILVPLDGSSQSAAALPLLKMLAKLNAIDVTLIGVEDETLDATSKDGLGETLDRIVEELRPLCASVRRRTRVGDVPSRILGEIQTQSADLVLMATHGRAGVSRTVLGSVAQHVVARSPVPVLVVRPGGKRVTSLRTVLVPVDGTAGGALALSSALDLAHTSGARIEILQVVAPMPVYVYTPTLGAPPPPYAPEWEQDALAAARQYTTSVAERIARGGKVQAHGQAVIGPVAPTIITTAQEMGADLIVMATHAYRGIARALLGSVADAVIRDSRLPVLLVRRELTHVPPARKPTRTAVERSRTLSFDPSA